MDVVGDIQATGVNYEKVYPAKRRRLTVPALASPDKEPHAHINETQLDYKEVRKFAPTFARMERDPSLISRARMRVHMSSTSAMVACCSDMIY